MRKRAAVRASHLRGPAGPARPAFAGLAINGNQLATATDRILFANKPHIADRLRAGVGPFARDASHYPFEPGMRPLSRTPRPSSDYIVKDSIPDMTADAVEIEGSTVIGHRGRRRYFASGTGAGDPGAGDSGSITIRAVFTRDASVYPAQNDRATNELARDAFARRREEPFARHGVRVPPPVRVAPAVAALPVPSIAQAHFAIGPWLGAPKQLSAAPLVMSDKAKYDPTQIVHAPAYRPEHGGGWRKERANRLAPYERTQVVRTEVPSLVRHGARYRGDDRFDYRLFAIYLLSTIIVAAVAAITICLI